MRAALAERDEAVAAAEALRGELERERLARRAAGRPAGVTGLWYHSVDDRPPHPLEFRAGGRILAGEFEAKWTLEGRTLRMSWPNDDAPGGSWEDVCVVADDGASYSGRNRKGMHIRGTRRR